MQQMQVTVPAGVGPGMPFQVNTPAGPMNVAIPEGKAEGESFAFQYQAPAQPAVAVAVAMPVAPVAAVAAVPQAVQPQGFATTPAREPATWKKGICGCFGAPLRWPTLPRLRTPLFTDRPVRALPLDGRGRAS